MSVSFLNVNRANSGRPLRNLTLCLFRLKRSPKLTSYTDHSGGCYTLFFVIHVYCWKQIFRYWRRSPLTGRNIFQYLHYEIFSVVPKKGNRPIWALYFAVNVPDRFSLAESTVRISAPSTPVGGFPYALLQLEYPLCLANFLMYCICALDIEFLLYYSREIISSVWLPSFVLQYSREYSYTVLISGFLMH